MIAKTGETLHLEVYTKPHRDLARAAADLGYAAWRKRFVEGGMTNECGLKRMFDPARPERTLESMKRAAHIKPFVGIVAIADDGETSARIGVLWGANDISGNPLLCPLKRERNRAYAWVAQANVHPSWWREGVGRVMLGEFLRRFEPSQPTTAYAFRRNPEVIQGLKRLGYTDTGSQAVDYFGNGPQELVRLQAKVSSVQGRLAVGNATQADTVVKIGS